MYCHALLSDGESGLFAEDGESTRRRGAGGAFRRPVKCEQPSKEVVNELERMLRPQERGWQNVLQNFFTPLSRISNAHNSSQRTATSSLGEVVLQDEELNFLETVHSPLTIHHSLKKAAFTLAEVLITLGVIGVVAALTIPNIIQNYKRHVAEVRLEKFYSSINQAIKMAELTYGDRALWYEDSSDYEKNKQWFEKYIIPYLNVVKTEEVHTHSWRKLYYLSDGSAVSMSVNSARDYYYWPNNAKKCIEDFNSNYWEPQGKCLFTFFYAPNMGQYNFEPFDYAVSQQNIEYTLKYHKNYGCYIDKVGGMYWRGYCAKLIQYNGWKFPKDYPYNVY